MITPRIKCGEPSGRVPECSHSVQTVSPSTVHAFDARVSVDDAAVVLWTYSSPEVYELLVIKQKWPLARYGDFISDAIIAALLPRQPNSRPTLHDHESGGPASLTHDHLQR